MNASDIVARLAAEPSRTEKEQIIFDAFMKGEREFFTGAKLAYDPLISFGVKKVAEIIEDDGESGTLTFADFLSLAHKLRRRELTGHAARDAINAAALSSDYATWNLFYRRILMKDLKCGAESSTINKVLKKLQQTIPSATDYMVQIFSPQLATDGADDEGIFLEKYNKGVKLLDIKFDGVRLITVMDKESGTVTQYTREGRINENFPHIVAALEKVLPNLPGSIVLDGEVTAGSFQELMEQLNTKDKADATTKLALFDIIPLSDFRRGLCEIEQEDRHEMLVTLCTTDLFTSLVEGTVYVLPKIKVDLDTPEGRAEFKAFLQKISDMAAAEIEKHGASIIEGMMVKNARGHYHSNGSNSWVRTDDWLKIKPVISVSLHVTGLEQGKSTGKFANTLGGLICEGVEEVLGKDRQIKVVCGGGLTEEQRKMWWDDPSLIVGWIVEIVADKYSKPKKSDVWSLRFPRFKGIRGTKPGEKI
jgi:DNA ligase-1